VRALTETWSHVKHFAELISLADKRCKRREKWLGLHHHILAEVAVVT
jgi:hypothetical protein